MGKYNSLSHSKTRLHYHIVLATKYRKKVLNLIECEEIIKESVSQCQGTQLRDYGVENTYDHIHLVISLKPSVSIGSFVKRFKQLSTHKAWAENAVELGKVYWGNKKRLWSSGYFAESLGCVSEDIVLEYVKNQ